MHAADHDLEVLRHSAAHLLAHAVCELYPDTLLTIGPATPQGFFYDFLPKHNFKEADIPLIEARMNEIRQRNLPITHEQMPKEEARLLFAHNRFKLELIEGIPGETVGVARQGSFYDLCKGGHVATTGQIKAFKLLSISGSYWRANRDNQALQRISGTAFPSLEKLQAFEQQIEDAATYDHRRLGKQLDLFSFHDEGVGFPFFHPKGKIVLNLLKNYLRTLLASKGYQEIETPLMLSDELWKQSGHYTHYKNNMYFCTIEEKTYAVKPMNCPGAIIIYRQRPRSYRELPMRLAEFGLVHRFELSGVLHGLFRVRAFTIDDGHIFCTHEQIESEVKSAIEITMRALRAFGFSAIEVSLSTRPANAMGDENLWEDATAALKTSLDKAEVPFTINEGEGAFYGPKIEFGIRDSMGRSWQCGTIQLDFFQPQNFDLHYIGAEGTPLRPVVIHRAIYGSFERFFGILLEHHRGNLPLAIAPVQVKILTITDAQKEYGAHVRQLLEKNSLRAEMDMTSDPINGKIKVALEERVPIMIILGAREQANNTATLRFREGMQEGGLSLPTLVERLTIAARVE